jgi:hypothetical protein
MYFCSRCGAQLKETSNVCTVCGATASAPHTQLPYSHEPPYVPQQPLPPLASSNPHHLAARGFAQTFGLHPAAAVLTVVVNTMIFGGAGVAGLLALPTGGAALLALTAVSIVCGIILGIITYLAQKKWYDDDKESAVIKAVIVAFLTAIPVGLPGYLTIPAGIIGFFRRKD